MSQYCVETLVNAGITDIAFIIGGIGSSKVQDYYGSGEKFGAKFTYVQQDSPKGIAHAISLCKFFIDNEKFVVFLGDNIIQRKINDYVKNFKSSDATASLLLCEVDNPSQFGIAKVKDNKIIQIIEKPKNPPSNLAVTGIYFLTPYIFEIIKKLKPSWRNELEIADALQLLIEEKKPIIFDTITDFWKDTGTPNDIIDANRLILESLPMSFEGIKEGNVIIEKNVVVGKGTVIKNNTKIIGPVIIGKNCVIDEGTIIGENASIGDDSHLCNCDISNSIIMPNCVIDGTLRIQNSIIASNSKIIKKQNNEKRFLLGEGAQVFI